MQTVKCQVHFRDYIIQFLAELVAGMLAHMAADRSMSHSLNDAREAVCKISNDEATKILV